MNYADYNVYSREKNTFLYFFKGMYQGWAARWDMGVAI